MELSISQKKEIDRMISIYGKLQESLHYIDGWKNIGNYDAIGEVRSLISEARRYSCLESMRKLIKEVENRL